MKNLYTLLKERAGSEEYPFHMPGHKRRVEMFGDPYRIDITEIEGFDNLHHPQGILRQAQERAAAFFGAEETYFLINGSTSGILSAVASCIRPGETLLMGRNSHKSAYFAAELAGADVEIFISGNGSCPGDLRKRFSGAGGAGHGAGRQCESCVSHFPYV